MFRPGAGGLAALPVAHVVETLRPLPIEAMAGAPSFVSGAAIVRGQAVPVIDAGALFGGASEVNRWISFRVGERRAVLAVHDVIGVQPLDLGAHAAPPLLSRAARAASSELAALDGQLLSVLEAGRLVDDDVWRAMQAGADGGALRAR